MRKVCDVVLSSCPQSSSESLSDDLTGQEINVTAESTTLENPDNVSTDLPMSEAPTSNACNGSAAQSRVAPPAAQVTKQEEATAAIVTQPKIEQSAKEAKRQERKEEKKKQKRKEDKGIGANFAMNTEDHLIFVFLSVNTL